jgi:filamentous hemagglutinin family protein
MPSIVANRCVAEMRTAVNRTPSSRGSLGYSCSTIAIIAVLMAPQHSALAAPAGGTVVAGSASVSRTGSVTNVNQSSNKAIINWQNFSVAPRETVNFNQPDSSAATLNRVIGNERSVISGALNSNGQVYIVNSAGVLFSKGAQVNVGGLVASTLDITNQDFMAGNQTFSGTSAASIINQGRLHASQGGYVALLGKSVSNNGVITARLGTVAMASGNKITLNFEGNSLVDVTIDAGTLDGLVQNKQAIKADGGRVIMTALAADAVLSAQVNNTGIIQARTMAALTGGSSSGAAQTGSIKLLANGGTVNISGKLDASAPKGGNGGKIETSGNKVVIAPKAVVTTKAASGKTGTWLIDPDGYTIGAGGDMTGAQLATQLASNNVTILSTNGNGADGNINVNDAVSWSANTLTLNATNNVFVNNVMTATGTAGFAANYGTGVNADLTPRGLYTYQGATNGAFAGRIDFSGTGGFALNGANYTVISDVAGLMAARSNPAGNYVLGSDVASVSAAQWTTALDNGAAFTGNFNGLGHVITSFRTTGTSLFGTVGGGAIISNIGIDGPSISAGSANPKTSAGTLADTNAGSIVNSFVSGVNSGFSGGSITVASTVLSAGTFVGTNSGLIAQSYTADMSLNGVTDVAGGLVGTNLSTGRITGSSVRQDTTTFEFAGGSISGSSAAIAYTGGLVGVNNGVIDTSYTQIALRLSGAAVGDTSNAVSGGFVGQNTGLIDQSYSATDPESETSLTGKFVAGFVGTNSGRITNAYTTSLTDPEGNTASNWTAGFAYQNSGTINNAYTVFTALGTNQHVGFVVANTGTISNAYWYSQPGGSPVTDTSPAVSLNGTQAVTFSSYAGFDPANWGASVSGFPILRNLPVYISTNASSVPTYGNTGGTIGGLDASIAALSLVAQGLQGGGGAVTPTFSPTIDSATDPTTNPFTVVTDNGFVDAGTQAASNVLTSAAYANIKGFITVAPATLTLSGFVQDKVYDGTTSATQAPSGSGLIFGLAGNQLANVTLTSAAFTEKNAGTDKTIDITGIFSNGTNGFKASNYTLTNTTTADITPKSISAAANGVNKVYDGTMADTVLAQLLGMIAGDNLSLGYTAAFADKNAAQGKTVTVAGLSLTGLDSGNYVLQTTSLQTTATISPRPLNLSGAKSVDGGVSVAAGNLTATNVVAGDAVQLSGSATLASSAAGVQPIVSTSNLAVNNPNYTVIGSVGSVQVGGGNLVLDHVASGSASIATAGNTTTVTQTTNQAIIDWLSFSLAANETLTFAQPSSSAVVLNRVTGNASSVIAGALHANGRVFIINSAGVLFAAGSTVNVGALVASTLNVSDGDFNAGNYVFIGIGGNGSVVAKGDIVVVDGGFVALASSNGVSHTGNLTAPGGKAVLASTGNLSLTLNAGDAGLASYVVGNLAGTTTAAGTVNVAALAGNGGTLETAGVSVDASALTLNTGTNGTWSWTQNGSILIGAGGTFGGQFVANNLAVRNLALDSRAGDITVNDAVTWSANTAFTLSAANSININASITASGTSAGLVMNFGDDYNILSPASFSGVTSAGAPDHAPAGTVFASITLGGLGAGLTINGNAYTLIHSMTDLAGISGTGNYALAQNLDASGTTYPTAVIPTLDGTLTGLGHTISNLKINDSTNENLGLIGTTTTGSIIRDIGLLNVAVTGLGGNGFVGVGALVGQNFANISHAYSTGTVTGSSDVGGLVGLNGSFANPGNTISDSYSDAAISGGASGGLVGNAIFLDVFRSHATGNVTTTSNSGGLIGSSIGVNISDSYATGNVIGNTSATGLGGLVGSWEAGGVNPQFIKNAFATGAVTGGYGLGGLAGTMDASFGDLTIQDSHATGDVTGFQSQSFVLNGPGIGGLVGNAKSDENSFIFTITLENTFATGNVKFTGQFGSNAGGLVGQWDGPGVIDHSSASGNVTGSTTGFGAGGLVGTISFGSLTNDLGTGNVSGSGSVGGLAGAMGQESSVVNSLETGNVTGTGNNIGGVAGSNTGTIIGSHATGNVTGLGDGTGEGSYTGGVVGTNSGSIANSYFGGVVTGHAGQTGGIAGQSINNSGVPSTSAGSITDSFYNSQINPGVPVTNTNPCCGSGFVTGSQGLTTAQMTDVASFANGTEAQVVAKRETAAAQEAAEQAAAQAAAEAAAQQAAAEAAAQSATQQAAAAKATAAVEATAQQAARTADVIATSDIARSAGTPPASSLSDAGTRLIAAIAPPRIEDNIQITQPPAPPAAPAEDQSARRPTVAAPTDARPAARHRTRGHGAGPGATIRGIDINGQHFDLRGDAPKNAAPGQKPQ